MHSVVAKIMTLGAVAGIAAVLALSTGRTALGAEGAELSPDNATIRATDFSARNRRGLRPLDGVQQRVILQ